MATLGRAGSFKQLASSDSRCDFCKPRKMNQRAINETLGADATKQGPHLIFLLLHVSYPICNSPPCVHGSVLASDKSVL